MSTRTPEPTCKACGDQGAPGWSCHYCGNAAWHAINDDRVSTALSGVYVTANMVNGSPAEYLVRSGSGRRLATYNGSRDGLHAALACASVVSYDQRYGGSSPCVQNG